MSAFGFQHKGGTAWYETKTATIIKTAIEARYTEITVQHVVRKGRRAGKRDSHRICLSGNRINQINSTSGAVYTLQRNFNVDENDLWADIDRLESLRSRGNPYTGFLVREHYVFTQ